MSRVSTWAYGAGADGPSTVSFDRLDATHALVTYDNAINWGSGSAHALTLDAGFGAIDFRLEATHNQPCLPLCPDTLSIAGVIPAGWQADRLFVTVDEVATGYIHLWHELADIAPVPLPSSGALLLIALAAGVIRHWGRQ